MKKTFIIVLIAASALMTFYSFNAKKSPSPPSVVSIPDSLFKPGDIIFRDGRGFLSMAFRKMSLTDKRYSHAGIIHKEGNRLFVYHVIAGAENRSNLMLKERLSDFCSAAISNSYGVYRADIDGNSIDSIAEYYFRNKLEFDTKFDLSTDDKMYCTEMIYKILIQLSGNNNFLPLTEVTAVKYVACDNIYLSSHLKKIYSQENSK